jgi:perosamine synthetase
VIRVSEPLLGPRELELVSECVRTGRISSEGSFVGEFERGWAAYCGRRHGVAVSNGTAALQLALRCLDLRPGDEVVLPSFTIVSCALAVLYAGGRPVLVDSDPRTGCLDADQVRARLGPRTRAVLAVHLYGHPADMGPLEALCRERGLALVEDAAEAHGAQYLAGRAAGEPRWRRCGSFGLASTFSFYANKLLTTGEGGMVVTDDDSLAARLRSLRNLAFGESSRFRHEELGFNFRMTNLQAALGVAQLERIEESIAGKRRIADAYSRRLRGLDTLQLPAELPWARSVFWMYGVVAAESTGLDAEGLARRLDARGIETRPFFLGMHEQPALLRLGLFGGERYPVAERLSRQGLYLPSGLGLGEAQIEEVCVALREALA